uniref:M48 family metallopeptidase n=1 Tax=Halopseudomonas salegens TaxID=1434072 RepID=UPI0012FDDF2F|nr:M48 family metallopeptidase [Halopseudomonas salegens]
MSISELNLGVQVGQARSYLNLDDGGVFETPDQAGLMRLATDLKVRGSGNPVRRLEGSLRLILVSTVVILAMIAGSLVYGIPWISGVIAHQVPAGIEAKMGEQTLATLERVYTSPSELGEARLMAVRTAFQPYLDAFAERYPDRPLTLLFRKSESLGANAFALPGGIMVFTDDLIELAEEDEELIAILAHEVAHVVHRDGLRSAIQSSMALWLMFAISGDLSSASDLSTGLPALIANLSYSRAMEREADAFALAFMQEQELAPVHFANIMRRLDSEAPEDGSITDFLSTHPPTKERIRAFEQ